MTCNAMLKNVKPSENLRLSKVIEIRLDTVVHYVLHETVGKTVLFSATFVEALEYFPTILPYQIAGRTFTR